MESRGCSSGLDGLKEQLQVSLLSVWPLKDQEYQTDQNLLINNEIISTCILSMNERQSC